MGDFYRITTEKKKNFVKVRPSFYVRRPKDIMIRGGVFYAVWDPEEHLWVKDMDAVIDIIDRDIDAKIKELKEKDPDIDYVPAYMCDCDSGSIDKWNKFVKQQAGDRFHQLDTKVTFCDQEVTREDYVSKRLPYALKKGDISAYEELISTLYSESERDKLEWSIGAIISGDSSHIQKFIVLYGTAGSGKSTFLKIVQKLFEGYYSTFDAKSLASDKNQFSLESFKNNPLVAIQHDGDLSRIEDNTKLNSIVSHEIMEVNAKFERLYSQRIDAFLYMGTNKPVKITDAKSGIIRRLIDVRPSGNKIPYSRYIKLMDKINFELGAIAYYCLEKYMKMGENYYENYIPSIMLSETNDIYSFIEDNIMEFRDADEVELKTAWRMYKEYCNDAMVAYPLNRQAFKAEFKNYFREWKERGLNAKGERVRNLYCGFKIDKFIHDFRSDESDEKDEKETWLKFDGKVNIFDEMFKDCPAQLASSNDKPMKKWDNVKTVLSDIDVHKVHFILPPKILICIDFDLKDENGEKCFEKNLEAASKWPATYAEVSKGGQGIHLYYFYHGDVDKLQSVYDENIEIKVFTGKSSLRRKESLFNELPITDINSGLPTTKGAKKMVNFEGVANEKAIRTLIENCFDKKHHGATKPEVDFIYAILKKAYDDGVCYDVTDLRPKVLAFANNSTNQSDICLQTVMKMPFKSDEPSENVEAKKDTIVFYDVEVFPNLFVVVFKILDGSIVKLINPRPSDLEEWLDYKLVGFNCRRYDNHILYARLIGFDNERLYNLSQRIISGSKNAFFGEAYNLSYTDIYDFCSKKQSLKKWEIELAKEESHKYEVARRLISSGKTLEEAAKEIDMDPVLLDGHLSGRLKPGIHHHELGMKWDEPVPEDKWALVADYCIDDVVATEAVWKARQADFVAREILADIAGGIVNDTTNRLTTKFIFGDEKKPRLVYTDLATGQSTDGTFAEKNKFEGYTFDAGKNIFMDEDVGKGGYVYSEPGMYGNVALLDIASMHPNSIINMNCFGDYTERFKEILDARIAIKHGDFEAAGKMMGGALKPYLDDKSKAKDLAQALKIAINSVYGLTSASFDNPFRDIRNKNNIVALRGALFMVRLKHMVQDEGYTVAHIKTDSIKIPDADIDIINKVVAFGKKYGYTFEHEATYDRMCLVNDAVYIARFSTPEVCKKLYGYIPEDVEKKAGKWTATGTQFAIPYVFKTLFSKEPIEFGDMCETKTVTTALYLDMNENLGEDEHDYHFVGKAGLFCPILPGKGGGLLVREKDGKYNAAGGTKGYRWLESEMVEELGKVDCIDKGYYNSLVDAARKDISVYGDFEWFISEDEYKGELDTRIPF